MLKPWFLVILVCAIIPAIAQITAVPSSDRQLADRLKTQYPENELVYESIYKNIVFEWDKRSEADWPINANVEAEGHVICITNAVEYQYPVPYDNYSSVEKIKGIDQKRRTTRTSAADLHYESGGIFHNDIRYRLISENINEYGGVSGFYYEKNYSDIRYLTTEYILEPYPVRQRELIIEIPEWLNMEIKEYHLSELDYDKNISESKGSKIVKYTFTNLPPNPDEPLTPGPSHYMPHLLFIMHEASNPKGGRNIQMFSDASDLYAWYRTLASRNINNARPFEQEIKHLVKPTNADLENISSLYYWVQDNIRYIAFEDGIAGYQPADAAEVYNKRYGDCKGMANLLATMLKKAGYDARLTWLGTNYLYYDYSTPSLCVDNHVICTVLLDRQKLFLDPTEKFGQFGDLAHRIQGQAVLIEDGKNFILDTIPVLPWTANTEAQQYSFTLQGDNELLGKAKYTFEGESRTRVLRSHHATELDKRDLSLAKFITGDDKNLKISQVNHSEFSERDTTLSIHFGLTVQNHTIPLDDELYVDLNIEKPFQNYIIESKRVSPIAFSRKYDLRYQAELTIDPNITISHLPKAVTIDHPSFSIYCQYKSEHNKIFCERNIVIKTGSIEKDDFEAWNAAINDLDSFYKDLVILNRR